MEQIAFADVILLNKVDLVGEAEKKNVISRIKASCTSTQAKVSMMTID